MKVKKLILFFNLLYLAGYGQIKRVMYLPDNQSLYAQSVAFQLTKEKLPFEIIWNNYHSEHDIPDTSYFDLSLLRIKCTISHPTVLDSIISEPFVYSNHSNFYITDKVIIIPYSSFQMGMTFFISLIDTSSLNRMDIIIKMDTLGDSPSDRAFCFNYIPFQKGTYCFTGKDIQHWDVQTATINPSNTWLECQRISNKSQEKQPKRKRKTKHKTK